MVARHKVPGLKFGVEGRPRFPSQSLGKWHSLDSGLEDCLSQFVHRDFDTLKGDNYSKLAEGMKREHEKGVTRLQREITA